jgi:probable F420-dependent oxidoreductase
MTPFFNPGPSPYGLPRIFLGGVGPRMTQVAGEVADGFMVHPFSTSTFMRETTMPAIETGLEASNRSRADFEVAFPLMAVIADDDESIARGRAAIRPRLAFYGSTPAYRIVLETHGWGDLQGELNRLSKDGDWATMTTLITDDIVEEFVVQARPDEFASAVRARYGDMVQRVSFDTPDRLDSETVERVLAGFKEES